ncbi:MAG: hypothetical protein HYY35_03170 [Deltaproteobacteria bacterium]|nr:hypothetical protein [Deltaproteobacteria bacterium]
MNIPSRATSKWPLLTRPQMAGLEVSSEVEAAIADHVGSIEEIVDLVQVERQLILK